MSNDHGGHVCISPHLFASNIDQEILAYTVLQCRRLLQGPVSYLLAHADNFTSMMAT